MEIISRVIGVTSPEELALDASDDIVNNNTCAISSEELAIDYSNSGLVNADICAIKAAQISTNTTSNVDVINPDVCSKILDCKQNDDSDLGTSAVANQQNTNDRSNAAMLNLGIDAITAEDHADESENTENVGPDTGANTPEKLAVEREIVECVNSDTAHERNVIDTTNMVKFSKDVGCTPIEEHSTESSNVENVNTDSCAIISDQFSVEDEIITKSDIFTNAENQPAIDSSNLVMFIPDAIEGVNLENINSGTCEITSEQFSGNGSGIYIFNPDICASTSEEYKDVSPDTNATTCKQFAVDSSNIDIFNANICASTTEEYENDNTNIENAIVETGIITPDLFAIHTENMENINFDTYDVTHKQNVIDTSNTGIFNSEISAIEEHAIESSNMKDVNPEACTIIPEHFTVEKENMGCVNSDIYAITHNQQAFESSSIDIFNSKTSTVTTEEHAVESSNMKDISPDFGNTAEQLLLDSTNMEIVNLGVCTITPEQLAIIDMNSNIEILNPDTCNPPDEFALNGISDVENVPTNSKTPGEDTPMRYTQVYLIDYPDLEKMDLQYTQTIDVQEELLKAFSIPSSSNAESKFLALDEPQSSGATLLEYAQNVENQGELQFVVHPVSEPSTSESEATKAIERETLLEYSDDIVNNREEVLPNLAVSNIPVEPAVNEEGGDTLLKYYQNIEDQLQFSDFADPNSSIDESEFLALSAREDSATLNSEIPIDLADIRMESLIGSKVDKPPGNRFLLVVLFITLHFYHFNETTNICGRAVKISEVE